MIQSRGSILYFHSLPELVSQYETFHSLRGVPCSRPITCAERLEQYFSSTQWIPGAILTTKLSTRAVITPNHPDWVITAVVHLGSAKHRDCKQWRHCRCRTRRRGDRRCRGWILHHQRRRSHPHRSRGNSNSQPRRRQRRPSTDIRTTHLRATNLDRAAFIIPAQLLSASDRDPQAVHDLPRRRRGHGGLPDHARGSRQARGAAGGRHPGHGEQRQHDADVGGEPDGHAAAGGRGQQRRRGDHGEREPHRAGAGGGGRGGDCRPAYDGAAQPEGYCQESGYQC